MLNFKNKVTHSCVLGVETSSSYPFRNSEVWTFTAQLFYIFLDSSRQQDYSNHFHGTSYFCSSVWKVQFWRDIIILLTDIFAASTCTSDQFKCDDDKCIDRDWHCDGDFDCDDHSDEFHCKKEPTKNQCIETTEWACLVEEQCILKNWKCDGDEDCFDGTDEINCKDLIVFKLNWGEGMLNKISKSNMTFKNTRVLKTLVYWNMECPLDWKDQNMSY